MYEQHSNNLSSAQMILDSVNMDCQMMRDNGWYGWVKRWIISFK